MKRINGDWVQSQQEIGKPVLKKQLAVVRQITNNKYLTVDNEELRRANFQYNCYSFVAFSFKWEYELWWVSNYVMAQHLKRNTRSAKKLKVGTIVSFWNKNNELEHTLIVTDEKTEKIIHKPGSGKLEVSTLYDALALYKPAKIRYHNVKKAA